MRLSSRVRATALVSLAAVSFVNAQGLYFQDPKVCNTKFQYLGCANVQYEPFPFAPTNWDPKATADNSASYIDYDTGDIVNSTVTPYFCAQACEAHGYKYSAVWFERSCSCGGSLKIKSQQGADLDLATVLDKTSDAKCLTKIDGGAPDPCGGDRRQNCGSNQGARIFVNPSFQDTSSSTISSLAAGYSLLGCFKNARFPSRTYTTTDLASSDQCFSYCANLGASLVFMVKKPLSVVECHCGSGFSEDAQQAPDGASCDAKCSALLDSTKCDAGSQDCCQLIGGTAAPVYYNPKFMGCLVPVIPGQSDPPVNDNIPSNGYKCFATPAAIKNRVTAAVNYDVRTISASASFVATASPQAIPTPYLNYGCWQNTPIESIFNSITQSDLASADITVEKCVSFCNGKNLPFAALYGAYPNGKCACGDARKPNLPDTENRMQDCNQPCGGTTQQNCGGPQGPLIYAKNGQLGNNWAVQWTSTRSSTPVYKCAGGPTPTPDPTNSPSNSPSDSPSGSPTGSPSGSPTGSGSDNPTGSPTGSPGGSGSDNPTGSPTGSGSDNPTGSPTVSGSVVPTGSGSDNPTGSPTGSPTGTSPGDSGSGTGTGTGSGTGATPTSTTPGVPDTTNLPANTFVILQVAPYSPNKKRASRNQRRQSVGGFVGGAGPSNPNSCDEASLFGVRSGQLLSGGQPVSTDPGVDFIPFAVNRAGSITRTFTIIDGKLHWYNDLFLDGEAHFCQVNSGDVFITFNGDEFGPIDCTRVDIVVYYANQCVDGDVIGSPGVTPSGSGGVPTGTGDGSTPTGGAGDGSGDDDDIPEEDWYFREGHAPDNYPCTETTESWIPGETTFLPHQEL